MIASLILVAAAVALLVAAVRWRPRKSVRPARGRPARNVRPGPAPARRPHYDDRHALYHYDHALRSGRRYIGITNDPKARGRRHDRDPRSQRWLPTSTGVLIVDRWFPNYEEAHAAEIAAIRAAWFAGEDIANDRHVPRTKGSSRAARR